jgi:hypothetical protein
MNPLGGTAPPNSMVEVLHVIVVLPSMEPDLVCGAVAAQATDRQAKAAAVIASTDFVFIDDVSLPFEIAKLKVDPKERATVLSPFAKNLRFAASQSGKPEPRPASHRYAPSTSGTEGLAPQHSHSVLSA